MPVDPSFAVSGAEWRIEPVRAPEAPAPARDDSFGGALGKALTSLQASQEEAAQGSQALAAGQVSDPTSVVMAVERARLSMQLAAQLRTKAVEAAQDLFHTQV
jgi:flagellar hook-basal body complex protein FliE